MFFKYLKKKDKKNLEIFLLQNKFDLIEILNI